MGEEILSSQFSMEDHARFRARLEEETRLLQQYFDEQQFSSAEPVAGFELEAWLLDRDQLSPLAANELFLKRLDNPLASPELASFNFELNNTPHSLSGHVFSCMHNELKRQWQQCREVAKQIEAELLIIGILPTLSNDDLSLGNMSNMARYRALNREALRRRKGRPLVFDINGREHLRITHRDVMLESATTSFQIHMQMNLAQSVRLFNASLILSAPMVALTANSPFLFGKDLWDETRIPLFEQAVAVGGFEDAAFGPIHRVSFGDGYVRESLMECFTDNLQHYPVLLPVEFDDRPSQLHHLRVHNGTIWRWNRPLIGFDDDGTIHLRLEQRVLPAGPSIVDSIANAAFFYGAVYALANEETAPEQRLAFNHVRDNFYRAARLGLAASFNWFDGHQVNARELLLEVLLPLARSGLQQLGVALTDSQEYLQIIEQRLRNNINGACWQRAWVAKHGCDMQALTEAYLRRQESGEPLHGWTI
ncbi:MAG: glutamate--cysteine ligase [Gammaproteobacteria bacterium]|nr:glutamate--cysteine ligase [Gammaproteobacteria bacterium]